jgi:hypothetical protein
MTEKAWRRHGIRFIECSRRCAGGNPCLCNAGRPHVYHICTDPRCACHSAEVLNPAPAAPVVGQAYIKVAING